MLVPALPVHPPATDVPVLRHSHRPGGGRSSRPVFLMKIGTKSVLFGAHAFWFHPFAVALGWWQLYGFPWHPALWLCFFFHDIGYIGKPNMDGKEGEMHPELGAFIVWALTWGSWKWHNVCAYHSRYYA